MQVFESTRGLKPGMPVEFQNHMLEVLSLIHIYVFYKDKKHTPGNFRFNGNSNVYTITGNQYRYINTVPMLAIGLSLIHI